MDDARGKEQVDADRYWACRASLPIYVTRRIMRRASGSSEVELKRSESVELHRGLSARGGEVRGARRHVREISGIVLSQETRVLCRAHPDVENPRHHCHVLRLRVPMDRYLITIGKTQAHHVVTRARRIAVKNRALHTGSESGRDQISPGERAAGAHFHFRGIDSHRS